MEKKFPHSVRWHLPWKVDPLPTRDVNRDGGTTSANCGWHWRLAGQQHVGVIFSHDLPRIPSTRRNYAWRRSLSSVFIHPAGVSLPKPGTTPALTLERGQILLD